MHLARRDPTSFSESLLGQRLHGNLASLETEALVDAFRSGDPWAANLISTISQPLGQALAAIHVALGIERFIIMGGFALALGEAYRRELVRAARASCWQLGQDWDRMIVLGDEEDTAGMLGASLCARRSV